MTEQLYGKSVAALVLAGTLASIPVSSMAGGFIGLGVGVSPDYEGSEDYEAIPAPFARYQWESGRFVSLEGTSGSERAGRLKANIVAHNSGGYLPGTWYAGPLVQYRLKREDVDNKRVDRLGDVDAATEAGVFIGYHERGWTFDLAFAADVSDEHSGYLGYLKINYDFAINDRFGLKLGGHLTWADDDYMDTYFGVDGAQSARSGLATYKATSGFKDTGLTLTGSYRFNASWGLLGSLGYTRMLNDAEDSPLVDDAGDANQFKGVAAVTYHF